MFGSFALGFVGWIAQLVSLFFVLVGLVMVGQHQDGSALAFIVAVVLFVGGSYAKYVSRQSVRVRDSAGQR